MSRTELVANKSNDQENSKANAAERLVFKYFSPLTKKQNHSNRQLNYLESKSASSYGALGMNGRLKSEMCAIFERTQHLIYVFESTPLQLPHVSQQ